MVKQAVKKYFQESVLLYKNIFFFPYSKFSNKKCVNSFFLSFFFSSFIFFCSCLIWFDYFLFSNCLLFFNLFKKMARSTWEVVTQTNNEVLNSSHRWWCWRTKDKVTVKKKLKQNFVAMFLTNLMRLEGLERVVIILASIRDYPKANCHFALTCSKYCHDYYSNFNLFLAWVEGGGLVGQFFHDETFCCI